MKKFLPKYYFLLFLGFFPYYFEGFSQCATTNYPGNFIVSVNSTLGGIHNVTDTFRVNAGVTITVPTQASGCGYIEVNAKVIEILGIINANGAGNSGGSGGGAGGCWRWNGATDCAGIISCIDKDNCRQLRADGGGVGTAGGGIGAGAIGVKGNDALGNKQQCNSFNDDSGRVGGGGGGAGGRAACYAGNGGASGSGGNGSNTNGCSGDASCATTGGAGGGGGTASSTACTTYGNISSYAIEMGSGGGGAGGGGRGRNAPTAGGTGGSGGGYVKLIASGDLTVSGNIFANGTNGGNGGNGGSAGDNGSRCCSDGSTGCDERTYTGAGGGGGGGGGGSGGGILLDSQCGSIVISGAVEANGGNGGAGGSGGSGSAQAGAGGTGAQGGGGGGGRIKIFTSSCGANNITTTPAINGGTGQSPGTAGTYYTGPSPVPVVLTPGSISGNQTICEGTPPSPLANVTSATLGSCTTFIYQWQESLTSGGPWTNISGATSATYNPPALSVTTFFRRFVTAGACSDSTNEVSVTINPSPGAEAGFGVDSICTAGNVLLGGSPTASGGASPYIYSWSPATGLNDATIENPIATVSTTTTYVLTVTGSNGCFATDTVTVTFNPLGPVADAGGGGSNTLCSGNSIMLGGFPAANGGVSPYTFSWIPTTGLNNSNSANPIAAITANITYTLSVLDSSGCQAIDSVMVTYNVDGPVADAGGGNNDSVCTGGTILLGGNPTATVGLPPYTYSWMPSPGLSDTAIANPLATITSDMVYYVNVMDSGNCQSTDSVTVIYNPSGPIADAGFGADVLCSGGSILLGGNPTGTAGISPYTYSWIPVSGLDNPASSNPIATVSADITYILTLTDSGGCQASDSVLITYNSNGPIADAGGGNGSSLCSGGGVILGGNPTAINGNPPYSYTWIPSFGLNSDIVSNPIAAISGNITYIVSVVDSAGCQSADTVAITFDPSGPFADAGGSANDSLCTGGSALLGGSPTAFGGTAPYSYSWSPTAGLNNSTSPNPIATVSGNTMFIVVIQDSANCQNLDSVIVTYNPSGPSAEAGFGNDTLCAGADSLTLLGGNPTAVNGIAPYFYAWLPAAGLNNSSISNPIATIDSSITYLVVVTDAGNCINVDEVTVNPLPVITINPPMPISCSGQTTTLTANGAASYFWQPGGQTTATIAVAPSNTTTYTVFGTDSNGCTGTDTITVFVPFVITAAGGSTNTVCNKDSNGTATVTAVGGISPYSYQWDANSGGQIIPTATGLKAGFYFVTVTDASGCTDTVTIEVKEPPPMEIFTLVPDSVCYGFNVGWASVDSVAYANHPLSYLWSDSLQQTTRVAIELDSGFYTVVVTDTLGCVDSATVKVTISTVKADFSATPLIGSPPMEVVFSDSSKGNIYKYFWDFGDSLNTSSMPSPTFNFQENGEYTVLLIVSNDTCIDTASMVIIVEQWEIPNIFTPNSDGKNDVFTIKNVSLKTAKADIFNRWGQKIYSWTDLSNGFWDGRTEGGNEAPAGVYYYVVSATGIDGKEYLKKGNITLVR